MANVHPSTTMTATSPAAREAMKMVPAQASLIGNLDARKIKSGAQFRAELSSTVHLKNGVELPRGTRLVGTVATDKMQPDGTSRLALRFTQAQLKDGKSVPIKATIVGYFPSSSVSAYGSETASDLWTYKTLQIDQIGAISGVDLHSRIASKDSGVFVSKKKDEMRLGSGSELALAIAARHSSSTAKGGV